MNKWIGIGRLTRDPELKTTNSGKPVCTFTMAIDRRFKSDGEKVSDFINCVAWNATAEFIAKYFKKGQMIAVEATIQSRKWQSDKGETHYATEAIIENVEFCGDGKAKNESGISTKSSSAKAANSSGQHEPESNDEDGNEDEDLPF